MLDRTSEEPLVTWIDDPDRVGLMQFTFDGETVFNLFRDYPEKLSLEQKTIFDRENPYWADFFKDRNA